MTEYRRLQELYKGPIAVRAGTQADGVGRMEKVWVSPQGGLWFTFDFEYQAFEASFALFVGYAIHRALMDYFAPLRDTLHIKWPNDIICQGKKMAGILCNRFGMRYIIGIGMNTNNTVDANIGKFGTISLSQVLGFEVSNQELQYTLINAVETYRKALSHNISYITYCNEHLFGKEKLALVESGAQQYEAEILGIDLQGALIIRKEQGEIVNLHSGSILSIQAFS